MDAAVRTGPISRIGTALATDHAGPGAWPARLRAGVPGPAHPAGGS